MSRLRFALMAALASGVLGAGILTASQALSSFPHLKHERLFPICEGCHAGITSGVAADVYPAASDCAQCHDGTRAKLVEWRQPAKRGSNLRFSHTEHSERLERSGDNAPCQSCHATAGAEKRMDVDRPRPEGCLQCHTHAADVHLADTAVCKSCHVSLARAPEVPVTRIANFPRPPWHEEPDFLSRHGRSDSSRVASCEVCHARQTCERCHANADRLPLVTALSGDARVAALEKNKKPEYPTPPSHVAAEWRLLHGDSARRVGGVASCANCHTRSSCASCHLGGVGTARSAIASLPNARSGGPPGVSLDRERDVHPANFAARHGIEASTGGTKCSQCHSPQTCASCHVGQESRAFHASNFVERHATDVFAAKSSCQSCHNTETFCRDCHTRTGIASETRMNAAFHTGQPNWVLSHGQAARMGMESCAACHRQTDCVRCHSAVGGWRVNPHGPGFPASKLAARNAASCRWCHSGNPPGGG